MGVAPTEDQHLTRFTAHAMSVRLNVAKAELPDHPDLGTHLIEADASWANTNSN